MDRTTHRARPAAVPAAIACMLLYGAVASSAGPARAQDCPDGQSRSEDTQGNCCWPGQAWSGSRAACVGIPMCGAEFVADGESCRRVSCPPGLALSGQTCVNPCQEGRQIGPDTQGQCCWPGQVWSASRAACVGVPTSCPNGLVVRGDACEAGCPDGREIGPDTAGHCCWAGQVWSESRSTCVGVPTSCPGGAAPVGDGCGGAPGGPTSSTAPLDGGALPEPRAEGVVVPVTNPSSSAPGRDDLHVFSRRIRIRPAERFGHQLGFGMSLSYEHRVGNIYGARISTGLSGATSEVGVLASMPAVRLELLLAAGFGFYVTFEDAAIEFGPHPSCPEGGPPCASGGVGASMGVLFPIPGVTAGPIVFRPQIGLGGRVLYPLASAGLELSLRMLFPPLHELGFFLDVGSQLHITNVVFQTEGSWEGQSLGFLATAVLRLGLEWRP